MERRGDVMGGEERGVDGGESGDEGDDVRREREKGFNTDEENSVVSRFVSNMACFELG